MMEPLSRTELELVEALNGLLGPGVLDAHKKSDQVIEHEYGRLGAYHIHRAKNIIEDIKDARTGGDNATE